MGRVLAAEYGIHSIHGARVSRDGSGILYIAPTGTGKPTSSYGLMAERGTRFHSDDWVFVRYTYRHRYGGRVLPVAVRSGSGEEVCGLRVYRWIDAHPEDGDALVTVRTLMDKEFTAENFPLAAGQLLRAKLESVPHVGGAFLAGQASTLDVMEAAVGGRLARLDGTARRVALARLIAFDNGRAILDLGRILERGRAFSNPMEPLRLGSVFLLKRDFASDAVLQRLQLPSFMARLLLGETPAGTREVANNAYRAVDDAAQGTGVGALEAEVRAAGEPVTTGLCPGFAERAGLPESLREEFELFRLLHRAVPCYDLNTVLERAPGVASRPEAVERTLRLTLAGARAFLASTPYCPGVFFKRSRRNRSRRSPSSGGISSQATSRMRRVVAR